jgi:DNA-binding helix-hairpin-helix protein with protein kinase domain
MIGTMAQQPLSAVLPLDDAGSVAAPAALAAPAGAQPGQGVPGARAGMPSWLADHVPSASPTRATLVAAGAPALGAGSGPPATHPPGQSPGQSVWVLDHLAPRAAPLVWFNASPVVPRLWVAVVACVVALCVVGVLLPVLQPLAALLWAIAVAAAAVGGAALTVTYRREAAVVAKRGARRDLVRVEQRAVELERRFLAVGAQRTDLIRAFDRDMVRVEREVTQLAAREAAEKRAVHARPHHPVRVLQDKLAALDRDQQAELQSERSRYQTQISQINTRLGALSTQEQQEVSNADAAARRKWLENALRLRRIASASIPNIGPGLKANLAAAGITTAADVSPYRVQNVPGIGYARATALVKWRVDYEALINASFPTTIVASTIAQIRERYRLQREPLERDRARLMAELTVAEHRVTARYDEPRRHLSQQLALAIGEATRLVAQETADIESRYARERDERETRIAKLRTQHDLDVQGLDARVAQAMKEIGQAKWELAQRQRAVEPYRALSFWSYLALVFLNRRR